MSDETNILDSAEALLRAASPQSNRTTISLTKATRDRLLLAKAAMKSMEGSTVRTMDDAVLALIEEWEGR